MPDAVSYRREMIRIGRLLYERQLAVATEGNLSLRLGCGRFLVTPSGYCKGTLQEPDLLTVDLAGRSPESVSAGSPLVGEPGEAPDMAARQPSSEWPLHRQIYSLRADVHAICHAHPPWATAFAAARLPLDGCLLPEIISDLGGVPLARYGTPGTDEVPAAVSALIPRHDALLLANHGVVTTGSTLTEAYYRLESVERLAQITLLARLAGGERRLNPEQVAAIRARGAGLRSSEERLCVAETVSRTRDPAPGQPADDPWRELADRITREILEDLRRGTSNPRT